MSATNPFAPGVLAKSLNADAQTWLINHSAEEILALILANGGTGGGPATIADGSDVTQGAKADAAVTNPASSGSVIALLKGLLTKLAGTLSVAAPAVTQHSVKLGASATQTIPTGAKEWTWGILTGTATVNGAAGLLAGSSDSSDKPLAAGFDVSTDAASSAFVRWAT